MNPLERCLNLTWLIEANTQKTWWCVISLVLDMTRSVSAETCDMIQDVILYINEFGAVCCKGGVSQLLMVCLCSSGFLFWWRCGTETQVLQMFCWVLSVFNCLISSAPRRVDSSTRRAGSTGDRAFQREHPSLPRTGLYSLMTSLPVFLSVSEGLSAHWGVLQYTE